jgi:bacterioferritin-associated ferredoxin|tara:strand:+ start:1220 stop:1447 length:228 start_codon:yes stop_codon:yes gene_type:complete
MRIDRKGRSASVYVCICNAIRESDLRRVARHCPGDAEACYAALGKTPNCGACLCEADEIVEEEREMAFVPEHVAA